LEQHYDLPAHQIVGGRVGGVGALIAEDEREAVRCALGVECSD
jgi:hypothetical protein